MANLAAILVGDAPPQKQLIILNVVGETTFYRRII